MFDTLSDRLGSVFDRLRGRGALSEADVGAAMREVRVSLLEADGALPVARDFVDKVTEKAVGREVLRSVTPGQTTPTAKLAHRLSERERKKVLLASLDVARPAAQEQLAVLGRQTNVDTL